MNNKALLPLFLFTIIGCSESFNVDVSFGESKSDSINPGMENAFASTYAPMNSEPMLFKSANIYDGLGGEFRNYDVLLSEGKIIEVGESITASGVMVVDATDKWITPGIIDIHSHMGVYSLLEFLLVLMEMRQLLQLPLKFGPSIHYGLRTLNLLSH